MKLNVRRADLGLPQFSDPPAKAVFSTGPCLSWRCTYVAGRTTIHLRVQGSTAQYVVVQAARPKKQWRPRGPALPVSGAAGRPNRRRYDLTELFVARYGVPKVGQAVWIRVFQHTDGWIDVPTVLRARVLSPAA